MLPQAADFDLNGFDLLSCMIILDENDDLFVCNTEEGLHSPPVEPSGPTSRGNWAWVVFNGQKPGVFETW